MNAGSPAPAIGRVRVEIAWDRVAEASNFDETVDGEVLCLMPLTNGRMAWCWVPVAMLRDAGVAGDFTGGGT